MFKILKIKLKKKFCEPQVSAIHPHPRTLPTTIDAYATLFHGWDGVLGMGCPVRTRNDVARMKRGSGRGAGVEIETEVSSKAAGEAPASARLVCLSASR